MMKPVEATGLKWEISKSKTATQLDSNYQYLFEAFHNVAQYNET